MTAQDRIFQNRGTNNVNSQNICLQRTEVNANMGAIIRQRLNFKQADHRVLLFKLFVVIPNVNDEDQNEKKNLNIIFRKQGMAGWRFTGSELTQNLEGYFENTFRKDSTERRFQEILKDMDRKKSKSLNLRFYYEF